MERIDLSEPNFNGESGHYGRDFASESRFAGRIALDTAGKAIGVQVSFGGEYPPVTTPYERRVDAIEDIADPAIAEHLIDEAINLVTADEFERFKLELASRPESGN